MVSAVVAESVPAVSKYICTVFSDSHLPHALTLWESLRSHTDEWGFVALRIGSGDFGEGVPDGFRQCCVELSALPDAHSGPRFWYEPFEFCNYAKCLVHEHLWARADVAEWWWVDGDCLFTDTPDRLSAGHGDGAVLLCPHRGSHLFAKGESDLPLLFYGVFNGGLLGVRRTGESRKFLDWFSDRLTWLAFCEPNLGLFVDQRWLGLAPCYFDCDMIRDPGVNVGYWNYSADHALGHIPTSLLHFSQVQLDGERAVLGCKTGMDEPTRDAFLNLAEDYRKRVRYWTARVGPQAPYPFGTFRDGRPVTKTMRRAYYCDVLDGIAPEDPFADGNRYAEVREREIMGRFVAHIFPCAEEYAAALFGRQPLLQDLRGNFSDEQLMRAIPFRAAVRALGRRAFERFGGRSGIAFLSERARSRSRSKPASKGRRKAEKDPGPVT